MNTQTTQWIYNQTTTESHIYSHELIGQSDLINQKINRV
jgi:hypothetical protein